MQEPKAPPSSDKEITAGQLGGTLIGNPFSIQSARYAFDRRNGAEKLDISLSIGAPETPCDRIKPEDAASVWIRRAGGEPLKPETVRLSPREDGPWQVHYQVHDEHGWHGNGDASALIVIAGVDKDLNLSGALWACFADATGSCVEGRFVAEHCAIRLDSPVRGSDTMERQPPRPDGAAAAVDGGGGSGEPASKDKTRHK